MNIKLSLNNNMICFFVFFSLILELISSNDINLPRFPSQFTAKAKIWFLDQNEPFFLLYHNDFVNHRTREDYYFFNNSTPNFFLQRFLTSIKLYDFKENHLIYHKISHSPHGCFVVPIGKPLIQSSLLSQMIYQGTGIFTYRDQNSTCQIYHLDLMDTPLDICLEKSDNESPNIDIQILDFQPSNFDSIYFNSSFVTISHCSAFS